MGFHFRQMRFIALAAEVIDLQKSRMIFISVHMRPIPRELEKLSWIHYDWYSSMLNPIMRVLSDWEVTSKDRIYICGDFNFDVSNILDLLNRYAETNILWNSPERGHDYGITMKWAGRHVPAPRVVCKSRIRDTGSTLIVIENVSSGTRKIAKQGWLV